VNTSASIRQDLPFECPSSRPPYTPSCVTLNHVETRNITLSLPVDLLRSARVYAAQRDTTINRIVRELLEEALTSESRERAAADKLLAIAENGPYFTADPASIRREELHERR
jgi:hypothetical protein